MMPDIITSFKRPASVVNHLPCLLLPVTLPVTLGRKKKPGSIFSSLLGSPLRYIIKFIKHILSFPITADNSFIKVFATL